VPSMNAMLEPRIVATSTQLPAPVRRGMPAGGAPWITPRHTAP